MQGTKLHKKFASTNSFLNGLEELFSVVGEYAPRNTPSRLLMGLNNMRANGRTLNEIIKACVENLASYHFLNQSSCASCCLAYPGGLMVRTQNKISFGWIFEAESQLIFWLLFENECLAHPDPSQLKTLENKGWKLETRFLIEEVVGTELPTIFDTEEMGVEIA